MELVYEESERSLLIGSKQEWYTTTIFDDTKSFIGFYGTQGSDRILELGFVLQDIACSERAHESRIIGIDMSGIWVVLGVTVLILLLFTITWYCMCQRKNN